MLGGQAIGAFDFAMAKYVRLSFTKALKKNLKKIFEVLDIENNKVDSLEFETSYKNYRKDDAAKLKIEESTFKKAYNLSCSDVEDETFQAMEAMVHNFNSQASRAGAQVPFSSLNYGMDISPEGLLVTDKLLDAIDNGLGNGETSIFPIAIHQIKTGINYNPGDPGYELFQKACRVSAKRLFLNFLNEDSSFNKPYYVEGNPNTYAMAMGCRTRTLQNCNGPSQSTSRGNFSFVTLNLPRYALEAKGDINKFWKLLDKYMHMAHDYLLDRYEIIAEKHVYNFPFLMGEGAWLDSEKLKPTDKIREVLKHASISIGYCGLAECLVALIGKHHGESEEAQELGLKIIQHIRDYTDDLIEKEHLNWSCFATPAESTAGTFIRADKKKYGVVPGVTEHNYYTNSFHCPVYYPISAWNKIKIEAPYHSISNAGHISYIEIDGDPLKNVKAFEKVVRAMHDADMGYYSIR